MTRYALQLAPLVFVRPGELRKADWSEIDLKAGEWRIPAERMKMKTKHIVPLRIAGVMEQIFIEGRARYGGGAFSTMIVKLLEDAVHTPLRAPGFPARLGPDNA